LEVKSRGGQFQSALFSFLRQTTNKITRRIFIRNLPLALILHQSWAYRLCPISVAASASPEFISPILVLFLNEDFPESRPKSGGGSFKVLCLLSHHSIDSPLDRISTPDS
jgi:hypothetical protein